MTWTIRPYDARDAEGIRYLWLVSFSSTPHGSHISKLQGIQAAEAMWREHRPIVDRLMPMTMIICDPEAPAVIWAFACIERETTVRAGTNPEAAVPVLHMAVVKSRMTEAGYRGELLEALMGDLRGRKARYTHVVPDVVAAWGGQGMAGMPREWTFDPYWLARSR